MRTKISNSISIMDSLLTLIGLTNTIFGSISFNSVSLIIRLILLFSGICILLFMFYSFLRKMSISNFITNNENNYRNQSSFRNLEDKKQWMFMKLSKKYPQMTCITLRNKIEEHYESIGNSK